MLFITTIQSPKRLLRLLWRQNPKRAINFGEVRTCVFSPLSLYGLNRFLLHHHRPFTAMFQQGQALSRTRGSSTHSCVNALEDIVPVNFKLYSIYRLDRKSSAPISRATVSILTLSMWPQPQVYTLEVYPPSISLSTSNPLSSGIERSKIIQSYLKILLYTP